MLGSPDVARALARDFTTAHIAAEDRAMLAYVVKLTLHPAQVDSADVDRLRAAGFDDTAILDICQVASYYNYVNRLADGLGVQLEDSWTDDDMTLTQAEFQERKGS